MEERDRSIGPTKLFKREHINLFYVTIRQSISLLVIKLLLIEIISATIFLLARPLLFSNQLANLIPGIVTYGETIFVVAVILKMFLTMYIVLAWINHYYEITPTLVRQRRGIIWVQKEQLALDDIQSVTIEQGLMGKILDYGTISLFDWKWKKQEYLYAVHNPMKYIKILETLLPRIDQERHMIREHIMEDED